MSDIITDTSEIVLNVGGKIFASTKQTLTRSTYFTSCLSFRQQQLQHFQLQQQQALSSLHEEHIDTNRSAMTSLCYKQILKHPNVFFVDRDGKTFAPILNFMRTGELNIPPGMSVKTLLKEAEFYGVEIPLAEAMESQTMSWIDDAWLQNRKFLQTWKSLDETKNDLIEIVLTNFKECAENGTNIGILFVLSEQKVITLHPHYYPKKISDCYNLKIEVTQKNYSVEVNEKITQFLLENQKFWDIISWYFKTHKLTVRFDKIAIGVGSDYPPWGVLVYN